MSVRCLVWRGEGEVVIGCLDGLVHQWVVGTEPRVMFAMDGSIIHLRWDHTHKVPSHPTLTVSTHVHYLYTICILLVYYFILLVCYLYTTCILLVCILLVYSCILHSILVTSINIYSLSKLLYSRSFPIVFMPLKFPHTASCRWNVQGGTGGV